MREEVDLNFQYILLIAKFQTNENMKTFYH